jgi:dTDP-glucose pyrophosphorylase
MQILFNFQTVLLTAGPQHNSFAKAGADHKSLVVTRSGSNLLDLAISSYISDIKNIIVCDHQSVLEWSQTNLSSTWEKIEVLQVNQTKGALASLLLTADLLDNELPILVAPVDGILPKKYVEDFVSKMLKNKAQAGTVVFPSSNPEFSYVRTFGEDQILEIAEKRIIGQWATTGLFYFSSLNAMISASLWALESNLQSNGTFYISNALNYFVLKGLSIEFMRVDESHYTRFAQYDDFLKNAEG